MPAIAALHGQCGRQGLCGPAARAGRTKIGTEEEEEDEPLHPVFNVVRMTAAFCTPGEFRIAELHRGRKL